MKKSIGASRALICVIGLAIAGVWTTTGILAQGQAAAPAVPSTTRLEIGDGSKASYRTREQFAGISFPSDAVGDTTSIAGTLVIKPDGSIDSNESKLTIDLGTFKSDQDLRDNYIRTRTLEVDK